MGGDSLAERYRYFRLHPFSLREWDEDAKPSSLDRLLRFGGFPEPLLVQDEVEHRIWQRDRLKNHRPAVHAVCVALNMP